MFDHIGLQVKDLDASVRFWKAALAPLGHVLCSQDESSAGLGPEGAPALWLYAAEGAKKSGTHVALQAKDRKSVDRFHRRSRSRRQGQRQARRPQGLRARLLRGVLDRSRRQQRGSGIHGVVAGNDRTFLIPAGLAAVCSLFGGIMFAVGNGLADRAERTHSWPSTEGVIVTNAVTTVQYRDAKSGQWYERPQRNLDYTFEVDGRSYTGHVLGFGDLPEMDVDQQFPVGAKVPVYYDPSDPNAAALTIDVSVSRTPFYAIGIVMGALALPFFYLSYRMRPKTA
jgi:catechol 2,3-dioxygenase-like lactoylglutathione lyase family enzyme